MVPPWNLVWSTPSPQPHPLPPHVTGSSIPTPSGNLELLSTVTPSTSSGPARAPLFFVHGGFGSAAVWLEYMSYFSQSHNIPCYAVSLRGHGSSWRPSFLGMVYLTGMRVLADDLVAALRHVQTLHGAEVVLVGHSSGGGLAQYALDEGLVEARGLALLAATPCFGQLGVYHNWYKLDPWFGVRMLWHLWHPKSPLASTALVKAAFFCERMPMARVQEFEKVMAPYESYMWPLEMMRPDFVNVKNVLGSIKDWSYGERVLVMAGGEDKLMGVRLMQQMASRYRAGYSQLVAETKIDVEREDGGDGSESIDAGQGVRFCVVAGAGHHLQNDVQWEDGAVKLRDFYEQL